MPDLRGSITTDLDQHITLARLEAIYPPAAKRPHQQDAYLVARAPEPYDLQNHALWNDWAEKSDLMRRLVAKFELSGADVLKGAPVISREYLLPLLDSDRFRRVLHDRVWRIVHQLAPVLSAPGPTQSKDSGAASDRRLCQATKPRRAKTRSPA